MATESPTHQSNETGDTVNTQSVEYIHNLLCYEAEMKAKREKEEQDRQACVSCDAPTDEHLCDDCFADLPDGEWTTV